MRNLFDEVFGLVVPEIGMIEIVIKKTSVEQYDETVNFVVKEIPTQYTEDSNSSYDSKKKVVMEKHSEPRVIRKERPVTTEIYAQRMPDSEFDLKGVIAAINNLSSERQP